MKKINCASKCKKTSQMKCSSKCMKIAFIKESSITYSCDAKIKTEEERNFYNCELIDNGIEDACKTCNLPCINKSYQSRSKVKADSFINNMGFDLKDEDGNYSRTIASYAKKVLEDGTSGKNIDMDKLSALYKIIKKTSSNQE